MAKTTTTLTLIPMVWLMAGCGQTDKTVRPDQMSAEAHRQEAQKDRVLAGREQQEAQTPLPPPNMGVSAGSNPQNYYDLSAYDPTSQHLARAQRLGEHARQHEAAAASLEKFEETECKQFPAATRAACPLLGPVARIVDTADGVAVQFAEGTRIDAVLAHMRCHLAFAATHGFDAASSCPLYMKGVDIRAGSDPRTIQIVGADKKIAEQIQSRSREEALLVQGGGG